MVIALQNHQLRMQGTGSLDNLEDGDQVPWGSANSVEILSHIADA